MCLCQHNQHVSLVTVCNFVRIVRNGERKRTTTEVIRLLSLFSFIAQKIPAEKSEPLMSKDVVLSDDDFPPRGKFVSKAPAELVESDSDMDDELFSGMNSAPVNPTPPSTTPSVSAPLDDVFGSDIELSDGDDTDSVARGTAAGTRRSTRVGARTGASNGTSSMSRNGRARRNSISDPLLDFDEPIRPYKPRKPTKTLFSLDSLLKEKERKERIGYDLQTIKSQVSLDGKVDRVGHSCLREISIVCIDS